VADYIGAIDQGTTSSRFHPVRRRRPHRARGPEGARADHAGGRLGRARRHGGLAAHARGDRRGARQLRRRGERHRGDRHHQPARDHRGLGPRERRARLQRDRLAGHPHRPARARIRRRRRPRPPARQDRPAALHLLLGTEDRLDPRQRGRRARARRERRAGLRDDGHLGALEPDRRQGRRPARDGRDQRVAHPDDGPRDARLARAEPRADGRAALDAPGDPLLQRGVRRGQGHRRRRPPRFRHPR